MPVFQTSYSARPAVAVAGMAADSQIAKDDISRVNQEAVGIPFGVAVVRGNSDDEARLPTTVGDVFLGASLKDLFQDNADLSGALMIRPKAIFNVRRLGRLWVYTEEATVEGQPVFYRIAAQGLLTVLGAFRQTDDGTTAASTIRLANARWCKSHAAGLGCLELLGAQPAAQALAQT